jgi:type IV secretory pathway VirB10-like protein
MRVRRILACTFLISLLIISVEAQERTPSGAPDVPVPELRPGSERPAVVAPHKLDAVRPQTISLTLPKGTSLQVALEKEVRIRHVGQSVRGIVVEPVYAFDRLVVPVGSKVGGEVIKIERTSGGRRTLAGLDGDFTPPRRIEIGFTELLLADGKQISLKTIVTPGSGQILKLASAPDHESKKTLRDVASEKTKEAKQQARDQWNSAMKQLRTPGRIHRIERYAQAQLPVHPQYIPAGTMYFAELQEPLNFGTEILTPQTASSLGGVLPDGSVVHARLITPLSSATSRKGQEVEAVLTRPLLDGQRLVLPQGSRLRGSVRQVQPARRLKKNGQLRIAFDRLMPPDGLEQKVQATLVGVQAGKEANVKLDSEGGAEATTSKARYGDLALSLGLAAASVHHVGDRDGDGASPSGTTSGRMAGGMGGFKLVGALMGAFVQSRAFGYSMGAYGAGMSIYRNFMARGHDVVFPKNTAMEISLGAHAAANPPPLPAHSSGSAPGQ